MSGNSIFLDTNILIYLLQGDQKIAELIDNKTFTISFITELELLSIPANPTQLKKIKSLLKECYILNINDEIKKNTIDFRNKYNVKLPDAIVAATAHYLDLPLITADKGFKKIEELNLFIYEI
jgi:predicted nucleic acid-binding protein